MSFKTTIPPELHLAIETVLKSLLADPPIGLPMRSRLLTVKETCVYQLLTGDASSFGGSGRSSAKAVRSQSRLRPRGPGRLRPE